MEIGGEEIGLYVGTRGEGVRGQWWLENRGSFSCRSPLGVRNRERDPETLECVETSRVSRISTPWTNPSHGWEDVPTGTGIRFRVVTHRYIVTPIVGPEVRRLSGDDRSLDPRK